MIINVVIYVVIGIIFISALYTLKNYNPKAHFRALKKGSFILSLSALPAIGVLFVKGDKFQLLYGELFIYTAAYLAPVIYWFYERLHDNRKRKKEIKGDWFTFFYAIILLVITALFYGAYKRSPVLFVEENPYFSPWFLLGLTIILWYSNIAFDEDSKRFVDNSRREEDDFVEEVSG